MYEETIWVKGLRILTWILLVGGVIGGIYSAWTTAETMHSLTDDIILAAMMLFLVLIISLVGTFIIAASIMVFLDIAADVSTSKQMTYEMLRIMQHGNAATGVKCAHCDEVYNGTYNSCPLCGDREQKPTLSSVAEKSTTTLTGDFWRCTQCDEKNPSTSRTCKGCGKYK
jgi:uncharacterized membrane protein